MFTCVLGRYVASTVLLVPKPNMSGGANSVGGQLRGDKECPFSGVSNFSKVWRKVDDLEEEEEEGKERGRGG